MVGAAAHRILICDHRSATERHRSSVRRCRRCQGMAWLIESEGAAARQAAPREEAPPFLADRSTSDAVAGEPRDFGLDVTAHEVELVFAIALGRVDGDFGGRQRKDQPAAASIDRGKPKHVTDEGAGSPGVPTTNDGGPSANHGRFLAKSRAERIMVEES